MNKNELSPAVEAFRNEYEYYTPEEMSDRMYMDQNSKTVGIYPTDNEWIAGLHMERYCVNNFEVEEYSYESGSVTTKEVEVYHLKGEFEESYLTREIADRLLETFDLEVSDFVLHDEREDYPVILELDDPKWNAIIAPRIPSEDTEYK